jgi:hypothetical protein
MREKVQGSLAIMKEEGVPAFLCQTLAPLTMVEGIKVSPIPVSCPLFMVWQVSLGIKRKTDEKGFRE